jgi:phi LC3 family holin
MKKFKEWLGKINWGLRLKDPANLGRLVLVVGAPVLTYYGLTAHDLTSWPVVWDTLGKAVSNPFVLGTIAVSAYGWLVDPTTSGTSDSKDALTYTERKEDK